ncbi:MAG TPA: murein biosynthesis integral membrane protein MurJ [Nitrospirota bacterium]|nr:murein biosynthesis integral membrane protein MurJ [Nitrospirota bacterium]
MEENTKSDNEKHASLKNSLLVLLALGLSSISQIITQIIIAYLYGSGRETDALFVAFVIPTLLFWSIQNSSRVSIVPLLTDVLYQAGHKVLWKRADMFLTVVTVIITLFAIIISLLSPYVISIIAPGLHEDTSSMAATILRILSCALVFAGILGVWGSLHNIFSSFFIPALTDFFRAGVVIVSAIVFYRTLGIYAIPIAFVVGSLIQCMLLIPGLRREGYRYSYYLSFRDPNVSLFFSLTSLPFLSLLIRQGGTVVDRFLASYLPEGSISALTYSYTIGMGVILIVSGGLFSVSLPDLSRYSAQKKIREMKDVLQMHLKLAGIITFPLTVLLILLGRPMVCVLFERGAFSAATTELTASLLSYYAIGIFFLSAVPVMLGVFYAFKDTYTPFVHLLQIFIVNTVLAIVLMRSMGVQGISLALSLAGIFSFVRMAMVLEKRIMSFTDRSLFIFWMKSIVSSLVMGFVVWFIVTRSYGTIIQNTLAGNLKVLALSLLVGTLTFGISAYVLRIEGSKYLVRKVLGSS